MRIDYNSSSFFLTNDLRIWKIGKVYPYDGVCFRFDEIDISYITDNNGGVVYMVGNKAVYKFSLVEYDRIRKIRAL